MATISIIGRGLDPGRHISTEAIAALKQADIVLGIEPEKNAWGQLCREHGLSSVVDLGSLYKDGAKDVDNYETFLETIRAYSDQHAHIAVLVAGHPRLGVSFVEMMRRSPSFAGHDVRVVPGLSSFDIMINDLGMDPLEQGTVMVDANRLLLFGYDMIPDLNYFIYHVCSVGTSATHYGNPEANKHLAMLQKHLLSFYPREKRATLCKASNGAADQGSYVDFSLAELALKTRDIDFGTTLFIPASRPSRLNRDFLKLLKD